MQSCVNVVLECISPESASMGFKLSNEIRQLPVNHKAKGKMLDVISCHFSSNFVLHIGLKCIINSRMVSQVKRMTIYSVNAAVEEINKVPQAGYESLRFGLYFIFIKTFCSYDG